MNTGSESFRITIPMTIIQRSGNVAVETDVVTRKGVFIQMQVPPVLMAFMRIRLDLPLRREGVLLNGVVTRLVDPIEPGGPTGVSITFYGKGGQDAAYWDEFIDAAHTMRNVSGSSADAEARGLILSLRPCLPASSGSHRLSLPSYYPRVRSNTSEAPPAA